MKAETASLRRAKRRSNPGSCRSSGLLRFACNDVVVAFLGLLLLAAPAHAAAKLHVGKAINVLWIYTVLDVGIEKGIFDKYGLDVEISVMPGDAKFQQALIAKSIDIGLAGGPSMALGLKGSPAVAVAQFAGAPANFSVNVAADSSIKTVADLKDKLLATATAGSLPEWLIKRLSIHQGWGVHGIRTTATGGFEASLSATLTHQVDGFMGATEAGLQMEAQGRGRVIDNMQNYVPHFVSQVVSTRQDFVAEHPDLVERFLKALFASTAFVKNNKDADVAIATKILNQDPKVIARVWESEKAMLSDDGTFDSEGLEVLKDSFVEMGILEKKPDNDQMLTTKFLPVRP
jgi:NitT/TauT family transport system substrate-binding protein